MSYSFMPVEIAGKKITVCHALDGGAVIGTATVMHEGLEVAEIARVFVRPEYRRKGLGRTLVEQCCAFAGDSGCSAISLIVEGNNAVVIPWYGSMGFRLAYQYPDGDLILSKQLTGPIAEIASK